MSARLLRLPTGYQGSQEARFERPVPRKEIAEHFGVSTRTVDRWVQRGMPDHCWISTGCHKRFYPSAVTEWLGS